MCRPNIELLNKKKYVANYETIIIIESFIWYTFVEIFAGARSVQRRYFYFFLAQ